MKTDKFVPLGVAAEKIDIGQQVEYLPSTGLVRKRRPYTTVVNIHADGSMDERRLTEREEENKND